MATSPGTGLAVNGIIATNNILGQHAGLSRGTAVSPPTAPAARSTSSATSNATINAENEASTDAKTTSVGVVLAFNTIGIKQPVAGFLENTVDALFGTDLAGEQPDEVYAYMSGATATASDGVDVDGDGDVRHHRRHHQRRDRACSPSGISVAATVTLNRIATDVEAWISGGDSHRDRWRHRHCRPGSGDDHLDGV